MNQRCLAPVIHPKGGYWLWDWRNAPCRWDTPAMRTSRIAVAVVSLAASFALTGTALADTPNVLVNPGFEQGLTGWHPTGGTLTLAAPHTGANSAQITRGSQTGNMTIQPSVIPLVTTKTDELYSAGAWVYAPRAGMKLCVVITERDQTGTFVQQTASCRVSAARTWEHVHGQWASRTAGHSLSIGVQEWYPLAGDWFDADDVELTGRSLPHNVVAPTLSGDAVIGATLTASPAPGRTRPPSSTAGSSAGWSSAAPSTPRSENTWVIPDDDFGRSVRVVVEAQNAAGITLVATAETATIPEPPA